MNDPRLEELLGYDRAHLWHPYSSALTPQHPYLVESASGVRLRLRLPDGSHRDCIDAMSSWWCAIHGYAVPELDAAARTNSGTLSHTERTGEVNCPDCEQKWQSSGQPPVLRLMMPSTCLLYTSPSPRD